MAAVLFVCTANICRSPMAMALFKEKIDASEPGWRVESAGTWAPYGRPAAESAQFVLRSRGLDLGEHRSRVVTEALLQEFDLILTMERGHKEAIQVEFPQLRNRIYLLSEMIEADFEIRDPIGEAVEKFEETAAELDQILTRALPRIRQIATQKN